MLKFDSYHEQTPVAFKLAIIALAVKPLDANFKKRRRLKRVEEVGGVIERTDNILLTQSIFSFCYIS